MLDAYRKGDQEARDWISSFRPQTQNLVNEARPLPLLASTTTPCWLALRPAGSSRVRTAQRKPGPLS
jgi:hypothetical protein